MAMVLLHQREAVAVFQLLSSVPVLQLDYYVNVFAAGTGLCLLTFCVYS